MYRERWRFVSLLLFFYGHLVAGLAGYETIISICYWSSAYCARVFPSRVALRAHWAVAIVGSIIMAGGNPMQMAISVLIAVAIATIGMVIIIKFFGKKLHLLNKIVLMDATDTESWICFQCEPLELIGHIAKHLRRLGLRIN